MRVFLLIFSLSELIMGVRALFGKGIIIPDDYIGIFIEEKYRQVQGRTHILFATLMLVYWVILFVTNKWHIETGRQVIWAVLLSLPVVIYNYVGNEICKETFRQWKLNEMKDKYDQLL